jgi:2-polyprenyl-3-methyl-5-hydroxy-6-metoxy-1,4-benzoquinol methylase
VWFSLLICPLCKKPLLKEAVQYSCQNCGKTYPDKEGIIQFAGDTPHEEQYFPDNAFEFLYLTEEENFWFRVRNKIIGYAISRYVSHQSRILEVGCGTGYVSRYMKKMGYHVECADLFLDALQFCKERDAGDFYYQYDLSDRLFINEFDSICAFDVLEHIDDDVMILKNLYNALKPAGTLVITVPADMRLWSSMDIYAEHKRRYSMQELRQKIERNGFKVIKMSYFMTLLYPFILISRKLSFQQGEIITDNAKSRIKRKAMNELHPNPILNLLFFLVFSMEVPLLRSVTLPFGSSLLCVAVKEQ